MKKTNKSVAAKKLVNIKDVKDWNSLRTFVYDVVSGVDKRLFSDEQLSNLNHVGAKILLNVGEKDVAEAVNQIMELNILNKNVNFKVFDSLPAIWMVYYHSSIKAVSMEYYKTA